MGNFREWMDLEEGSTVGQVLAEMISALTEVYDLKKETKLLGIVEQLYVQAGWVEVSHVVWNANQLMNATHKSDAKNALSMLKNSVSRMLFSVRRIGFVGHLEDFYFKIQKQIDAELLD